MKILPKLFILIMAFALLITFTGIHDVAAAATNPKITIKKYKNNSNFKYAVISGSKYKTVNKKMLDYVTSI
ncbi:hypothetical protein ACQKND_17780 [Viridibacillus arvi]|uniref:hypothetical protein n=1 Tax=Viridibacillus arvi TaxID=263475 RepID=UPI003CFE9012